jgi:hypothetical protein
LIDCIGMSREKLDYLHATRTNLRSIRCDGKDFIQFHTSGDMDETAFKRTPQCCTSPFTVLLLSEITKSLRRGHIQS